MKNILIGVLVIGVLILGYFFIDKKQNSDEMIDIPVGDTPYEKDGSYPPTSNPATESKLITRDNYSFKAPKEWIESGPHNFDGCVWDGVSNDTSDGHRQAGEIGIYPKSCFNLESARGRKKTTEKDGYYILAFYDREGGTTAAEEAETLSTYKIVVDSFKTNSNSAEVQTTILVPLITQESMGADFGPFGCGAYLSFVPRQVPQTSAVLNATYEWLFSNPASLDGGNYYNTVATQTNLDFQSVEIVNGTAKVYLTGSVMGAHCGDATFATQIEQVAIQYPTVSGIEVYVNGEIFDWCDISDADPEESGCDENPKLWSSQKFFEI